MADYADIALGLLGGLGEGVKSYSQTMKANKAIDAEMAAKGMKYDPSTKQYVVDPEAEARKRKESQLKIFADLAPKGLEPEFDQSGEFKGVKPSKYFGLIKGADVAQQDNQKLIDLERLEDLRQKREERIQQLREKSLALETPYGKARTVEDAKVIKEAEDARLGLNNLLDEMIALREKYGGEFLNREAVSRGKQLSKQALLLKKKLDGLGVLSQSDMEIVNAIIPEDPLAFTAFGDPVMERLKSLKSDTAKTMEALKKTRLREGEATGLVPQYEPDVLEYAQKYGITPEEAQKIKKQRMGAP